MMAIAQVDYKEYLDIAYQVFAVHKQHILTQKLDEIIMPFAI